MSCHYTSGVTNHRLFEFPRSLGPQQIIDRMKSRSKVGKFEYPPAGEVGALQTARNTKSFDLNA